MVFNRQILESINNNIDSSVQSWIVTVISSTGSTPGKAGMKILIDENGRIRGTIGGGAVEKHIIDRILLDKPKGFIVVNIDISEIGMMCGGIMYISIDPILDSSHLYIFGGGHCGLALSEIASKCGFCTHILDNRQNPEIDYSCSDLKAFIRTGKEETYIVIMTHSHEFDELILRNLIRNEYRYIGVIGSKKKAKGISDRMIQDGFDRSLIDNISMPIGIDIGSETPYEIAISILAQLISVREQVYH